MLLHERLLSMTEENQMNMNQTEDFLLAEYNNIAQAHFKTMETISTFFKQYLLVVSLPLSVLAVSEKAGINLPHLAGLLLGIVVSLVGLCVFGYMINLRLDALLYAKTINGLRQHFFNKSGMKYSDEIAFRTLPRTTHQPHYLELNYFGFVALTFIILISSYLLAGIWYYFKGINWHTLTGLMIVLSIFIVVAILHIGILYWPGKEPPSVAIL